MNLTAFFDAVRGPVFDGTLSKSQVSGCETLLTAFALAGWPLHWAAYGLATAKWETAHTMQPITERGSAAYFKRMYDPFGERPSLARANGNTQAGDGARYRGRGYVQLTWRNNYRRAGEEFGQDLEGNPGLATVPEIAASIMVKGMEEGWFTGKKCSDYLSTALPDYYSARRIINGTDKAATIARLAMLFEAALRSGDYQPAAKPSKPEAVRSRPSSPPPVAVSLPKAASALPPVPPVMPAPTPSRLGWLKIILNLFRRPA